MLYLNLSKVLLYELCRFDNHAPFTASGIEYFVIGDRISGREREEVTNVIYECVILKFPSISLHFEWVAA